MVRTTLMRTLLRSAGIILSLALPAGAMAAQQSFADLPASSPYFAAAEYLKGEGILEGYADGTFKPDQVVNRAEVIKLIVSRRLPTASTGATLQSSFTDVANDAWFAPYVMQAYDTLRIIDGPPKTRSFNPSRPVSRAEFLKMLLLAYDVDPVGSYAELTPPIAADVADANAWFYPYVRYAVTASILTGNSNNMEPAKPVTRGDMADMLYRFLLYREGKQTQTLLSVTENETLAALRFVESDALPTAEQSAARAVLASRGALSSRGDDATVKSAVKTAEAAMVLVQAAQSVSTGDTQKAIERSSTAWHLGEKAKTFSSSMNAIVGQLQKVAAGLADSARKTN